MLDPALLRPGRFDRVILVDVPDAESRKLIFAVHTKSMPLSSNVNIDEMVKLTDGFVGADIEGLIREAAMNALRHDINSKEVGKHNFDEAFKKVKASVSPETAKKYKKLEEYYIKSAKSGLEVGPLYAG
jgi:transitional endoplasmic reticulum ATPase